MVWLVVRISIHLCQVPHYIYLLAITQTQAWFIKKSGLSGTLWVHSSGYIKLTPFLLAFVSKFFCFFVFSSCCFFYCSVNEGKKHVRIQCVNSESQVLREPVSASGSLDQAVKMLLRWMFVRLCEGASFLLVLNYRIMNQVNFHSALSIWNGTLQIYNYLSFHKPQMN